MENSTALSYQEFVELLLNDNIFLIYGDEILIEALENGEVIEPQLLHGYLLQAYARGNQTARWERRPGSDPMQNAGAVIGLEHPTFRRMLRNRDN